ncbi:MAG: glutathione peroxidase [Flavobacteriaceae bacterium]|nr:glutathione peroxidase [Flavobacteriaceae bacterium]
MKHTFFDFEVNYLNGKQADLNAYKGKTIIVVNTASKCGLTPQYEGLEALYKKYKDQDLVILGFPCNQFGKQEQGNADQIQEFCQLNYGLSFPMFEKIEVNGKNTHPIYQYLKSKLSGGLFGSRIKWNFTKFVIDKNGKPVKRFAPTATPQSMETYIQSIL